jgi:hypothetical protein
MLGTIRSLSQRGPLLQPATALTNINRQCQPLSLKQSQGFMIGVQAVTCPSPARQRGDVVITPSLRQKGQSFLKQKDITKNSKNIMHGWKAPAVKLVPSKAYRLISPSP